MAALRGLIADGDNRKIYHMTLCPYYRDHEYEVIMPLLLKARNMGWEANVEIEGQLPPMDMADMTEEQYKLAGEWGAIFIHGTHPRSHRNPWRIKAGTLHDDSGDGEAEGGQHSVSGDDSV